MAKPTQVFRGRGGLHWGFGACPPRLPGGLRERIYICIVKRGSREAASAGEGRALAGSRMWAANRALRSVRRRRPAKVERLRDDAESGASVVAGLRRKGAWREALGCMRRGVRQGSFCRKKKKRNSRGCCCKTWIQGWEPADISTIRIVPTWENEESESDYVGKMYRHTRRRVSS